MELWNKYFVSQDTRLVFIWKLSQVVQKFQNYNSVLFYSIYDILLPNRQYFYVEYYKFISWSDLKLFILDLDYEGPLTNQA